MNSDLPNPNSCASADATDEKRTFDVLARWPELKKLGSFGVDVTQFTHGWRAGDSAIVASLATYHGWKVLAVRRLLKSGWITGAMASGPPEQFTLFYWRRQLHCDFAIQTGSRESNGSGIIVLDFDKPESDPEVRALLGKYGRGHTVEVRSGRKTGGFHLYYQLPEGLEFKNQQKLWGLVDVRGYHGLAVLPGSHHKDGPKYVWAKGRAPDEVEVLPLPTGWLEALPQRLSSDSSAVPKARKGPRNRSHNRVANAKGGWRIGDGSTTEGYGGFHGPIYSTAIKLLSHAPEMDEHELVAVLRKLIQAAPVSPARDASDIVRYTSEEYLLDEIKNARTWVTGSRRNGND